jgi:acyl-CoA synthetase (AMP-forming)/AMP-acid ligase II
VLVAIGTVAGIGIAIHLALWFTTFPRNVPEAALSRVSSYDALGSFVLMPAYEPRAYLDALAKYKCTYSRGVAAVFTMFLQHGDYLRTLDLSALRGMTIGSAVVTPELLDAVERALPHVKVSESYGLTEGGSPLRAPIDGRPVPRGSPGVPAPDIELRLVDAHGRDAEEGELPLGDAVLVEVADGLAPDPAVVNLRVRHVPALDRVPLRPGETRLDDCPHRCPHPVDRTRREA